MHARASSPSINLPGVDRLLISLLFQPITSVTNVETKTSYLYILIQSLKQSSRYGRYGSSRHYQKCSLSQLPQLPLTFTQTSSRPW